MVETNIDELLDRFHAHCLECPMIEKHIEEEDREYHIANEIKFQSDFLVYERFVNHGEAYLCCDMIGCDWELKFKVTYKIEEVTE